jgi:inorganic pyrophosphatase/exopolyphosphatase
MKVVTSYFEPDLDGTSSMYAYAELLNKQGEDVGYYIWGNAKNEVAIVCNKFNICLGGLKNIEDKNNKYILVDLNSMDQMHEKINEENLIEIIDHHGLSRFLPNYKNASRVQIDKLGAAATIVTERYKASGFIPSREAAIMLYYGIISNSINFKASITSPRDIEAAKWLKSICDEIREEKIKEIFMEKSNIKDENLRVEMECELPMKTHEKNVLVCQLEICNIDDFIKQKEKLIISILKDIKQEKEVDYLFVNCVDILNGFSLVYCLDEKTKRLVEEILQLKFNGNLAKAEKLIQRKEMTKAIREYKGDLDF